MTTLNYSNDDLFYRPSGAAPPFGTTLATALSWVAVSILAALYGYKDMIDGEANRQAAALKARRLHIQGTPSAADVLRP